MSALLYVAPVLLLSAVLWRPRGWQAIAYLALVCGALAGAVETLGRSRPIWAEWRPVTEATVLGAHYDPGNAIYVWALIGSEPRAYRLPWSEETARKMQTIVRGGLPMLMDYENQRPTFYPAPQPANPPK